MAIAVDTTKGPYRREAVIRSPVQCAPALVE